MTTLTISINVTTPDLEDVRTITLAITKENIARMVLGLPALPFSTPPERRGSYETILVAASIARHRRNIEELLSQTENMTAFRDLRGPFLEATPAKRAAALAALA